jgi:hypothetical protein
MLSPLSRARARHSCGFAVETLYRIEYRVALHHPPFLEGAISENFKSVVQITRHVRLAYQPPVSSIFLSKQISHQQ